MNVSVCLCMYVCVFIFPRSYLWNCTSDLHQIFVHVSLWLWLGPPVTA